MTLNPLVQLAREYAIEHHQKQMYGEKPYVFHLDQVYDITIQFDLGLEYQIAAYLHDIIEDTDVTKKEIENKFGIHISEMVFAVSGFGSNRKERQQDIKIKMLSYQPSINLKMADRLANMLHSQLNKPKLYELYCKEHLELEEIFKQGNSLLFSQLEQAAGIKKISKLRH